EAGRGEVGGGAGGESLLVSAGEDEDSESSASEHLEQLRHARYPRADRLARPLLERHRIIRPASTSIDHQAIGVINIIDYTYVS
ncbi:Os07g0681250, partial [Oryza sativa Japonica Group]